MAALKEAALRKRSQIAKANKTMFLWVAAISGLVGFALVVSIFLGQKLFYNERVLAEKEKTVSILKKNNAVVDDLENEVRVLDTNTALASVKANPNDQAIQVILDALPSEANSLALGASIQGKLLANINGLSIESIQVDPVVGVESLVGDEFALPATTDVANEITFQVTISGSEQALRDALSRLERSIRAIEVKSVKIESQGDTRVMAIEGRAFYEPAKVVELQKKEVK